MLWDLSKSSINNKEPNSPPTAANTFITYIRLFRLIKAKDILNQKKIMFIIEKIAHGTNNQKVITMCSLVNVYKIIRLLILGVCITYIVGGFWFGIVNNMSLPTHSDNQTLSSTNFTTKYSLNSNNSNTWQR